MDASIYYNGIAKGYENLYRSEQLLKALFARSILEHFHAKNVIDVGAGTGILEEICKEQKFTIVEPSKRMLEILRKKHLDNIVKIYEQDFITLDINEKFDASIAITVLQDVEENLREKFIDKMLKIGNIAVISFLKRSLIDMSKYNKYLILSKEVSTDMFYVLAFK